MTDEEHMAINGKIRALENTLALTGAGLTALRGLFIEAMTKLGPHTNEQLVDLFERKQHQIYQQLLERIEDVDPAKAAALHSLNPDSIEDSL